MENTTFIHWDWKQSPNLDALNRALNPFGLKVYEDPTMKDTDTYGYVISRLPLTEEELQKESEEYWGEL